MLLIMKLTILRLMYDQNNDFHWALTHALGLPRRNLNERGAVRLIRRATVDFWNNKTKIDADMIVVNLRNINILIDI